ncbi:MAG: glutamyl-tRNA reductase, partial [Myxococcales bacterium]|nr:glutamyl-tRNA reductase [Myxococcales bacterium]
VPRDVDPDVLRLDQVFLYNIDDLQGIVADNLRSRGSEAERAGALLEGEIDEFLGWQRTRAIGPLIQRLNERARTIADGELERLGGRLRDLTPAQRKAVESLAHGIVRKLLHPPITALRGAAGGDDPYAARALAEAIEALFQLEGDEAPAAAPARAEEGGGEAAIPAPVPATSRTSR